MADPFIAEIIMFGGNFAPRSWANCNGQLLPIAQNSALFSLLGTNYGGDGRTSFALPDMRGRVPIHPGSGPGLSNYVQGHRGGVQDVILDINTMPTHNHAASTTTTVRAQAGTGQVNTPSGTVLAGSPDNMYGLAADTDMGPTAATSTTTVNNAGNNQSFSNVQPWCSVRFIIALQGVFPSRS
ncbi:Microcystin dependent protein [Candidatus Rhodobacter oscarellae]|uniref:Microcystin dependent protein n=1 Tax=Candidatus Rhodobacter oscarellae TaxID=1675527 RepID=A0A0J9GVC8_9RHOB|nr:tail fiber protein [Candidatus Rhodobacter lobularis]KMW57528.1 Microcystin dependent protein [Candidatus Rhodobacter lobularis]